MKIEEFMKTLKILYVEDEQEAREELVDVLKRRAGKVYVGDNGKKGLALAEDYDPDMVITDLYMPEMNGIEMIRKIRESGKNPAVIVISAINDVDTILSAIDVGIDKYILKPVNVQELLSAMAEQAAALQEKRKALTASLPENRKQIEEELKREVAAFLKAATGKGPRDVNVFMGEGRVEIVASGVMTTLEKSILDNGKNISVVKYIRELFFSAKQDEICSLISNISGKHVVLKEVNIHVEKDKNKLIFTESML